MEENLEAKCTTKSEYFHLEGMFQLLTDAREPSQETDYSWVDVKFATNNLRQTAICFGSAHLHRTCGLCSKGESKKAEMRQVIFSFSLIRCSRNSVNWTLEKWATTAWAIWNARNRFYFEHVQVHPKVIFENAMCCLKEYQRLMESQLQRLWIYRCWAWRYFLLVLMALWGCFICDCTACSVCPTYASVCTSLLCMTIFGI